MDELLVALLVLGDVDDHHVHRWVASLDEALDGLSQHALVELGLSKLGPDFGFVCLLCKGLRALEVVLLLEEDLNSLDVLSELLVDAQGFVVELVLVLLGNLGELLPVIVVQTVDVVHHSALVGLDRRQNQEVLEVSVVGEARVVEHNSLEELDELVRKLGGHEGLDGARDLVGVFGLRKGGGDNLVDDLLSVLVLRWEHLGPERLVLPFDQVSGLHPVEEVLVRHLDELLVALSPGPLVGGEGQVGVPLLAVLADYLGVVVLVVDEEALWVLVDVNVDLGEGVVESWLLDPFVVPLLEPSLEHSEFASALELLDQFWDRADPDGVE